MDVLQAKEFLEESTAFKQFKKDNPNYYFVHAFWMVPGEQWKLGYYEKDKDRIVVFDVGEEIFVNPEEEVYKEESQIIELKLEEVRVRRDEAIDKTKELLPSSESITQTIAILQHLERPVWNITLVTGTFNVLNVKVDAQTGTLLSRNAFNVLSTGPGGLGTRA